MHVWGWASWRRAWSHYDVALTSWPGLRATSWLPELLGDPAAARAWTDIFDRTHAGLIDTWDFQLTYAVWARSAMVATPNVNLVTNVGAGADATHTHVGGDHLGLPASPMTIPLVHPDRLEADREADRLVQAAQFTPPRRSWAREMAARILGRR
jgi:hypothetical protein